MVNAKLRNEFEKKLFSKYILVNQHDAVEVKLVERASFNSQLKLMYQRHKGKIAKAVLLIL